ncbi:MAG: hypothetical protein H7Y00_02045 [Fimbriimonadaceae bacterium]|nr:hypothetical protein [Chitinophagales bacterium]
MKNKFLLMLTIILVCNASNLSAQHILISEKRTTEEPNIYPAEAGTDSTDIFYTMDSNGNIIEERNIIYPADGREPFIKAKERMKEFPQGTMKGELCKVDCINQNNSDNTVQQKMQ